MKDLKREVVRSINSTIGKTIEEAYVTEPKQFDLKTIQIELYFLPQHKTLQYFHNSKHKEHTIHEQTI